MWSNSNKEHTFLELEKHLFHETRCQNILIQAYTTLGPTIYSFRAKVDDSDSCRPLVNILNINKWIKKKFYYLIKKKKGTTKL